MPGEFNASEDVGNPESADHHAGHLRIDRILDDGYMPRFSIVSNALRYVWRMRKGYAKLCDLFLPRERCVGQATALSVTFKYLRFSCLRIFCPLLADVKSLGINICLRCVCKNRRFGFHFAFKLSELGITQRAWIVLWLDDVFLLGSHKHEVLFLYFCGHIFRKNLNVHRNI